MPKILANPTVTHSGTHFIHALLDEHQVQYRFKHMYDENMPEVVRLLEEYPAIVPLRRPERVYESWRRRVRAYNKNPAEELTNSLWRQFDNLIDVVDAYDPCYLVLDSPHRTFWLNQANERLGLMLSTSWPVKTEFNTQDVAITQKMRDQIPDKVTRFFEERILAVEANLSNTGV